MKRYKAICFFTDLQDNRHPYNVGDIFPRNGFIVSENRIKELLGSANKQHRPVIEEVKETESDFVYYTQAELEKMTIAQIETIAEERGYSITQTLKADIIDEFLSQQ